MFKTIQYFLLNHIFKGLNINRSFVFNGYSYKYFYHPHGSCFNERVIEIPICMKYIYCFDSKDVLEVGNVLSMYMPVFHNVLDKYDKQIGIINEDVIRFDTMRRYKLIFSISTLEHVGFDESIDNVFELPDKALSGILNLKRLLTDGGILIVTMPIGYRDNLDRQLFDNDFGFDSCYFLKRISVSNTWKQIEKDHAKNIKFNTPYPKANGLFIGMFEK